MPVFNTAAFVGEALQSALMQMEVAQCVVIDDGCTDKSLQIIQEFAKNDSRVLILHHTQRQNLGPGPSRNLGLKAATQPYIAFLDADDYWKENRFKETTRLFKDHPDADGIYEARAEKGWDGRVDSDKLTMIRGNTDPEKLFFDFSPFGKKGHIALIGLTVKREVIDEIGYFSNSLWLTQDTEWMVKLALKCRLYPGIENKPVAIRRLHRNNSTRNIERFKESRVDLCISLLKWCVENKNQTEIKELVVNVLLKYHFEFNNLGSGSWWSKKRMDLKLIWILKRIDPGMMKYPRLQYFRNLVFHLPVKQSFDFYE